MHNLKKQIEDLKRVQQGAKKPEPTVAVSTSSGKGESLLALIYPTNQSDIHEDELDVLLNSSTSNKPSIPKTNKPASSSKPKDGKLDDWLDDILNT